MYSQPMLPAGWPHASRWAAASAQAASSDVASSARPRHPDPNATSTTMAAAPSLMTSPPLLDGDSTRDARASSTVLEVARLRAELARDPACCSFAQAALHLEVCLHALLAGGDHELDGPDAIVDAA